MKDYNNELEAILETKLFSMEVKNILLNMLYKINTAYEDYSIVKRNVQDKKVFINGLLNTIENCNEIVLMKTSKKDIIKENIYTKFKIDKLKRKIEVYPNEKAMLYALNEYNSSKMFLNENYKLIRNSLPELINKGIEINNTEVIRDFDAWSWNTQIDEIFNIEINLVFQNVLLLLGYRKLNELLNSKEIKSDLKIFENKFTEQYGEQNARNFIILLYKISIILLVNEDENERKRLLNEKKWIEKEFNRLNNKNKLLEDITNSKKAILEEIKKMDIILNNKELLLKEYDRRNETLPEHSKIFSLSHFTEILNRERKAEIDKIDEYNKLLEPRNYTVIKSKFERDLDLLSGIKLDGTIKNSTTKQLIKFQEIFMECMKIQIQKADNKREIIYLLYALRYYNFIPFSRMELIKDIKELKMKILELENMIIEKMYSLKIVNKNMEIDIIDNIFKSKIISLENMQFEFRSEKNGFILNLYDEETIAETIPINLDNMNIKKIKFNKKFKLFN